MVQELIDAIRNINSAEIRSFSLDLPSGDCSDGVYITNITDKFYVRGADKTRSKDKKKPALIISGGDSEYFRRKAGNYTYEIKEGNKVFNTIVVFKFEDGTEVSIIGRKKI